MLNSNLSLKKAIIKFVLLALIRVPFDTLIKVNSEN